jgi:hypothetical protein
MLQSLLVTLPPFLLPALFICDLSSSIISLLLSLVSHSTMKEKNTNCPWSFFVPLSLPPTKINYSKRIVASMSNSTLSCFAWFVPNRAPLPCGCISTTSILLLSSA